MCELVKNFNYFFSNDDPVGTDVNKLRPVCKSHRIHSCGIFHAFSQAKLDKLDIETDGRMNRHRTVVQLRKGLERVAEIGADGESLSATLKEERKKILEVLELGGGNGTMII